MGRYLLELTSFLNRRFQKVSRQIITIYKFLTRKKVKTVEQIQKETDEAIRRLSERFWDLQDQTNKIKEAVLTGEKGDLKMPEEIPSEQTDNEYLKEQFGIYSRYVKSLSICTHVLTVISVIALTISIVALIV